ncbi:MAG: class I SAM-dependent methyltransferase [Mojavia pulchra JT2-VF2]|jgi:2-polyprenyl-3-methyl-5-hydroxy-6-metoxy-1,4-benzoquinol methylase|uniref:Class I SAM-dependent methyltransferase n=1 Tax=Mojavia pulchra JT2-VF2 TaxID=287848 RepID=A0A951Q448_9NOST|nr:class I SAM-dependent methyltransferase [Mojavia pulchra JT2-VF2]
MKLQKTLLLLVTGLSVASLGLAGCATQERDFEATAQTPTATPATQAQERPGDVPYVPTPQPVVDAMLNLAKVRKEDVLYDLGSGDGRIPITAAQKFGTRGIGIDINPERIQEANANAQKAGVTNLVQFRQQDLFKTDFKEATVVTLYLLPEVNMRLRPTLLRDLKPGTRIVSHAFDMGDWKPQQVQNVDGKTIYLWVVPENPPANLK